MRLGIFGKLFLSLFLGMLVPLGAMTLSAQWSFRQGFDEYLRKVEEERMQTLAKRLAQDYSEYDDWNFLRGNQDYWFMLLGERHPPHPIPPPPPGFLADTTHPHPPHPPPRNLFKHGHFRVFDTEHRQVIGPPSAVIDGTREILQPITVDDKVVGWIGFLPDFLGADHLETAFVHQYTRAQYAIAGLSLGVSLILSWLLARQFLRPVRRLTQGAHSLASGHYEVEIPVSSRDELGQLADDFNALARALNHHEQTRRQWVADTAHELRTPLAILRSELEALIDGIWEPTPERLRSLHGEILWLGKLVDDLHELSIHDLGALNYHMEILDPIELIEDLLQGFKPRFASKNIELHDLTLPGTPVTLMGDFGRLRQLFMNLFENSLRHTDAGGRCEWRITPIEQHAVIDIMDSEPGVGDTDLPRLFERFFRADLSRSRQSGGTGLGLAICRSIVTAHSGHLEARHSPLGGVWMRVTLPLAQDLKTTL